MGFVQVQDGIADVGEQPLPMGSWPQHNSLMEKTLIVATKALKSPIDAKVVSKERQLLLMVISTPSPNSQSPKTH